MLCILAAGLFVTGVNSTSVNTAIPAIGHGLHASFTELLWIVNIYSLVMAVLVIIAGRLGDLYGPKRIFILGLTVFAAGSLLCGTAGTPLLLAAGRLVQGLGAALCSPQSLSVISKIFPPDGQGAATGFWGAIAGGAVAAGPSIGGVLVQEWGWRAVFLVNVPVCLLAAILAAVLIPEVGGVPAAPVRPARLRAGRRRPVRGLVRAARRAVARLGPGGRTGHQPHGHRGRCGTARGVPRRGTPAAGTGAAAAVHPVAGPQFPADGGGHHLAHRRRRVDAAPAVAVPAVGARMPAAAAGLVLAIAPAISIAIAPVAGRYTDRHGGRGILVVGLLLFTGGLVLVAVAGSPDAQWPALLPGLVLIGVAMGVTFAPPLTIAMRDIPPAVAGAASGALNTIRMFGVTISSAIVGAVVQDRLVAATARAARTRPPACPSRCANRSRTPCTGRRPAGSR